MIGISFKCIDFDLCKVYYSLVLLAAFHLIVLCSAFTQMVVKSFGLVATGQGEVVDNFVSTIFNRLNPIIYGHNTCVHCVPPIKELFSWIVNKPYRIRNGYIAAIYGVLLPVLETIFKTDVVYRTFRSDEIVLHLRK